MDFLNTAKGPTTSISVERTDTPRNRRRGNESDKVDLDTFILARLGKRQVLKVSSWLLKKRQSVLSLLKVCDGSEISASCPW